MLAINDPGSILKTPPRRQRSFESGIDARSSASYRAEKSDFKYPAHPAMKTTEAVPKHAAEQGIAEEALKKSVEAKSKEFEKKCADVYAKT